MEALGRVELPTNGLGNRCSIHLSYRAIGIDFILLAFSKQEDWYWGAVNEVACNIFSA